jgi:hypothetical protein
MCQDGNETDVDCGGSCKKCTVGKQCKGYQDCATEFCSAGQCAYCLTDVDCLDTTTCCFRPTPNPSNVGNCIPKSNGFCT